MKVAVIQMNTKLGEPVRNEAHARELIESAMTARPDVLVLPELWTLGFFPENTAELADRDGQHIRHFLADIAREYRVNIVGGSTANSIGTHIYNTCYIFDRDGHHVRHDVLGADQGLHRKVEGRLSGHVGDIRDLCAAYPRAGDQFFVKSSV